MSNCADFKNEKSAMEVLFEELSSKNQCNIHLLTNPKYQCELAGEGIEYVWGLIKRHYRSIPFENKKGKDKFEKAIRECISKVTKEHVNICSLQRADVTCLPTSIRQKREKVGKLNLPVRGSKGS